MFVLEEDRLKKEEPALKMAMSVYVIVIPVIPAVTESLLILLLF
jgi:hypothetical protein